MVKDQLTRNRAEIIEIYTTIEEIVNNNTINVFEKICMIHSNMDDIEACFLKNEIFFNEL